MGFTEAVKAGLNNFFTTTGRSSRSEYWWYVLCLWVVGGVLGWFGGRLQFHGEEQVWLGVIFEVIDAILFASFVCASIRRLHDTGKSGWYSLLCIPLVFTWVILAFICSGKSQPGENQYGPEPR